MAVWTTRNPWGTDDDFWTPWDTPRDRARSLDGRALLRNFGPRPLETEEDRVAKSQVEMARLVRKAQQRMFMDRLMNEVDVEERVTSYEASSVVGNGGMDS